MRVLHVSEVAWGGVVSLVRDFTAEQARRGHEVSLLAPVSFPELGTQPGRRHDWAIDRRRPATFGRALAQLRAAVRAERPDVVHLHSAFAGFLGRLPVLSGVASSAAVVYQPHAWSFEVHTGARARRVTEAWERLAGRRTDVLVANCTDEIEQGRRVGVRTPAHALGVPIDVERFHPVDGDGRRHWREQVAAGERVLLCLGRLARQKGQDLLVAAWEHAPLPRTELLLVGPGDPEPLRRLAPTQWGRTIRWVGDQPDVRPYLWASDVLVLPSRYETVAVVGAEAMACGRPVVANRVNGIDMAVTDGPAEPGGCVVPAGDMVGLLEQSARLLDDPHLRAVRGSAGRRRVVDLFTVGSVVDRLDRAYEQAREGQR